MIQNNFFEKVVRAFERNISDGAFFQKKRFESSEIHLILVSPHQLPKIIIIPGSGTAPTSFFKPLDILKYRSELLCNNFFEGIHPEDGVQFFLILVNNFSSQYGFEDFFIYGYFNLNPRIKLRMPREASAQCEGLLVAGMRLFFDISF